MWIITTLVLEKICHVIHLSGCAQYQARLGALIAQMEKLRVRVERSHIFDIRMEQWNTVEQWNNETFLLMAFP